MRLREFLRKNGWNLLEKMLHFFEIFGLLRFSKKKTFWSEKGSSSTFLAAGTNDSFFNGCGNGHSIFRHSRVFKKNCRSKFTPVTSINVLVLKKAFCELESPCSALSFSQRKLQKNNFQEMRFFFPVKEKVVFEWNTYSFGKFSALCV